MNISLTERPPATIMHHQLPPIRPNITDEATGVNTDDDRTVWFPTDSLLYTVFTIPFCGIGGTVWGAWMAYYNDGPLPLWLFLGLVWGAGVWFFFSICWLIIHRQLSAHIPLRAPETLPERLAGAVKLFGYKLEQSSPTSIVYQWKGGLGRFYSFEHTKLHVTWGEGRVVLIGPAIVVNNVRKKLLAGGSRFD